MSIEITINLSGVNGQRHTFTTTFEEPETDDGNASSSSDEFTTIAPKPIVIANTPFSSLAKLLEQEEYYAEAIINFLQQRLSNKDTMAHIIFKNNSLEIFEYFKLLLKLVELRPDKALAIFGLLYMGNNSRDSIFGITLLCNPKLDDSNRTLIKLFLGLLTTLSQLDFKVTDKILELSFTQQSVQNIIDIWAYLGEEEKPQYAILIYMFRILIPSLDDFFLGSKIDNSRTFKDIIDFLKKNPTVLSTSLKLSAPVLDAVNKTLLQDNLYISLNSAAKCSVGTELRERAGSAPASILRP